jgi:acid phosphatase
VEVVHLDLNSSAIFQGLSTITMRSAVTFLLAIAGGVSFVVAQNTATSTSAVEAAAATALTLSPTSHVKGKAFDRIAIIFLENTDSDAAFADRE